MSKTVSFRVRYAKLGGHVHVKVWSSEFGPETTHGSNGSLVFRESEWRAFRAALEVGASESVEPEAVAVEFAEDPNVFSSSPFDPGGEAR